ncbi:MAG: phosphoribosylaminoimidazolesuccinocarboxamide synthase [Pirellulales bacterium]|nr:phosphoribosylaminoimidazolesuccinocarboxamide synthase [Pirellulales bacterium]
METHLPIGPLRRGKVRDIYDIKDQLLLVSTDRISAFDWVLPTGIPDKGRVLTGLSLFWFHFLQVPHHLISTDIDTLDLPDAMDREMLRGRSMIVRKTNVIPVECVVRGYLAGSGWQEYQATGAICGLPLPAGLKECDKLPQAIFTPATKAEIGEHDENISFDFMVDRIGRALSEELRDRSLELYQRGADHAWERGILIADAKFEFGIADGKTYLIDEVFTPDSSRFWPADLYTPGQSQPSFDKQFVRDWLTASGWDKNSPPPELPVEIIEKTRSKYIEAYERLTGQTFH